MLSFDCLGLSPSQMDVIFAMGADGSRASSFFNNEKYIINEIVDKQGSTATKYGLIQYGANTAETLKRLPEFTNNLDFKQFVRARTLKSPGRALIPAMDKAGEEFSSSDARRKALVLFANALPFVDFNDLIIASRKLRSQGVKVVVVYSGNSGDRRRLQAIVSNDEDLFPWSLTTKSSVTGGKIALQLFKGQFVVFLPSNVHVLSIYLHIMPNYQLT